MMKQRSNTLNEHSNQAEQQQWYRVGMVWLAIGLPSIVVLASLITVVIAHKNAPLINHVPSPALQQSDAN